MKRFFNQSKKLILVVGDIIILYCALYITLRARYGGAFTQDIWDDHFFPFTISFALWIVLFYIAGLYDRRTAISGYAFYSLVVTTVTTSLVATIVLFYLIPAFVITPKTNLIAMGVVFFVLFVAWRRGYNILIRSPHLLHPTMFIGSNKEMHGIIESVRTHPQFGYHVAGVIENPHDTQELIAFIKAHGINTLVYADHSTERGGLESISKILYALLPLGITIIDLPAFYARITNKIPISIIGEAWFFENLIESEKGFFEVEKRAFDIMCSFFVGLIALPFLPFIALCILMNSKGPVFYTQQRVGKNGDIFRLIKFRTMVENAERSGIQWTQAKDERITKVGNFLRRTRVDELPQLWNVLKGDMSFVGPRPERPEFIAKLEQEIPYYQMRHLVRPGLTGWAQIHQPFGGASVSDSMEKLQYDLYYIKNRNFVIDVDILAKTVLVILRREGR
ncbi:MAG: sugar transferase [Candidatus Azambacteria bacterium]|nr:sugar transferase [Candidatus Azambacteria bacterium]